MGRAHLYEGGDPAERAMPVRALRAAVAEILVLTNAAGSLRPDVVSGHNPNSGPKTPEQWFNLNAFNVDVPAGRHGNAGRNNILGPGLVSVDLGLHKDFSLVEGLRLHFRSDFFNLFNHAKFNAPVTDHSNGNIGRILTTAGPRELQLALKLIF